MIQRILPKSVRTLLLGVAILILAGGSSMRAAEPDPTALEHYRWQKRVLLVFAPDAADPRLAEQRRIVATAKSEAEDRDLVVIEAAGEDPARDAALRRRFGIDSGFRVVLLGKDGGAKLSVAEPLAAARWIETIDAMPMRRQERQAKEPS
ncbi:MAG: DUF4174 domain-containing protein [Microvirga sp.]